MTDREAAKRSDAVDHTFTMIFSGRVIAELSDTLMRDNIISVTNTIGPSQQPFLTDTAVVAIARSGD